MENAEGLGSGGGTGWSVQEWSKEQIVLRREPSGYLGEERSRRNGQSISPESGVCWECLRNSKETGMAGVQHLIFP